GDAGQECRLAMTNPSADYQVVTGGTGRPASVLQVAELLAQELNWTAGFEILRKFRAGDIRHCFADISRIRTALGYEPTYQFEDGIRELVEWVRQQQGTRSSSTDADRHLAAHGL